MVAALASALPSTPNQRVIVNMSFGFLAPLRMIPILMQNPNLNVAQQVQMFRNTSNPGSPNIDLIALQQAGLITTKPKPGGVLEVATWLGNLGPFLGLVSAVLQYPNVLLIAAAGNDSDRSTGLVFPPRLPAALEGVLGVSASNSPGSFASFSNRDDLDAARDDGIMAFSGERVHNTGVGMYDTQLGLMGPAVAPRLPPPPTGSPPGAANNTTGWAEWAGTSFAAPIVAAFAACVWDENPTWDHDTLIQELISANTGPRNELLLRQH